MANKKQIIQALIFLSIIAIVGILLWQAKAGTWKTNPSATSRTTIQSILEYTYKKDITFNTTSTGAAITTSQQNFPIAVHIASTSWPTAGDRSHFFNDTYNPGGKRVKFYDSDQSTALSYEVEYYDTSTQEALYWVRVPQVDGNSSTDKIVVAYGNDPNGSDQDNPTAVWDSNFKGVWHLGESANDSTSNGNNGSGGTFVSGQVDGGNSSVVEVSDSSSLNFGTGSFTISTIVNLNDTSNIKPINKGALANAKGYSIQTYSAKFRLKIGDGTSAINLDATGTFSAGTTYFLSGVNDEDSSLARLYINGSQNNSVGSSIGDTTCTDVLNFGVSLNGMDDEIRISSTNRSADWLKLEYYSMAKTNFNGDNGVSSPFITYGAEALTASAGAKKTIILGKAIQAYQYKKAITFNTTSTGAAITESQANFPIAVHLNTSSWSTQAERDAFFDNAGTDGKRVNFFDTDLDTALAYEVEYFSNAQGSEEAIYWVKVPQIDANSSSDKIYMGYGNDPYHADMSNPRAVWDSNFKMVQHMNDTTTSTITDSTSNANNGTKVAANHPDGTATGLVGYGQTFATDDLISITSYIPNDLAGTVSAIVKTTSSAAEAIWASSDEATTVDYVRLYVTTKVYFGAWQQTGDTDPQVEFYGNAVINDGNYHSIAVTSSGSAYAHYNNGVADSETYTFGADTGEWFDAVAGRDNFTIGAQKRTSTSLYFNGVIDEFRLSNIVRSADWIKLEYYSMKKTNFNGDNGVSSPFITYGSQEATR